MMQYPKTKFDANGNVTFIPPFYNDVAESGAEDKARNLNDIIESLFSVTRLKRKLFLINRKRKRWFKVCKLCFAKSKIGEITKSATINFFFAAHCKRTDKLAIAVFHHV